MIFVRKRPPNWACSLAAGQSATRCVTPARGSMAARSRRRHLTAALFGPSSHCDGELDDGETSLATSFMQTRRWFPNPAFGPSVIGKIATLGAVAAGAAIVEAALIPGILIGGAAALAPNLLASDVLSGFGDRRQRTARCPVRSAPRAQSAQAPASGAHASFDAWRALVKTFSYRVIVTTVDFGANYFVIGELAPAAGLSSLSLVAGPIAYFAHEAAWHYFGPGSAQHPNPLEATVDVPLPGAAQSDGDGRARFAGIKVSRALAKTVTYEGVTAVSEFVVNYLFVGDPAAAAGLTAFSILASPFVHYAHERAWDYYDATKVRSPAAAAPKLLPAT